MVLTLGLLVEDSREGTGFHPHSRAVRAFIDHEIADFSIHELRFGTAWAVELAGFNIELSPLDRFPATGTELTSFGGAMHTERTNQTHHGGIFRWNRATIPTGIPRSSGPCRSAGLAMMHFGRVRALALNHHDEVADTAQLLSHAIAAHIPLPLTLLASNELHRAFFEEKFLFTTNDIKQGERTKNTGEDKANQVCSSSSSSSPPKPSRPSRTMSGTRTQAASGSAQLHPRVAFKTSPVRVVRDNQAQAIVS